MSLKEWGNDGWLKLYRTSHEEIQNLLKIIERDLKDCRCKNLSSDWRFTIAYNAALQCCSIPLYCLGYKINRGQSEHYRAIQSIVLTLGNKYYEVRDYLNICRAKRNISDYDSTGRISDTEVNELIETVEELYENVKDWLKQNFPGYC